MSTKTLEEWRAEAAKSREIAAAARKARDEREELELYEAHGIDFERELVVSRFPDAVPELPGFVVCKPLPRGQYDRFMHTVNRTDKNATEAKAKFFAECVSSCRVYPSKERYEELCSAYSFVPDHVSGLLIERAKAGADREGKH